MTKSQGIFIAFGILFFLFIGCAVYFNGNYNLNKIKSKTVGDGQYGTARFATDKEVHQSLKYIEFDSVKWRKGIDLPKSQGLVVGSKINLGKTFGYVDCDDKDKNKKNSRSVKYRTKLAFEVDGKAYEGEETYNQKVYVGDKVKVEVYRTSKGIYKLRPYNNLVNFVFYCVAIPLGFIIAIASVYSIGLIVKKKE